MDSPRLARIFLHAAGSLVVVCLAFHCGRIWTAGPDGFRGSRPYQFLRIIVPWSTAGSSRCVGRPTSLSRFIALASLLLRGGLAGYAAAGKRYDSFLARLIHRGLDFGRADVA